MSTTRLTLIALLVTTGCTREAYRNADLQLDILAGQPDYADRIRICVEGVRTRTLGAGGGRYAVPGLPVGPEASVTVDVLVESLEATSDDSGLELLVTVASTGRVNLTEQEPWLQAELEHFVDSAQAAQTCDDCPEPCSTSTNAAEITEESWLLAARFLE